MQINRLKVLIKRVHIKLDLLAVSIPVCVTVRDSRFQKRKRSVTNKSISKLLIESTQLLIEL